MVYILFIIFVLIPLFKENRENEQYRQMCKNRGDKTYWSNDGLRYTDTNKKVTEEDFKDYNAR